MIHKDTQSTQLPKNDCLYVYSISCCLHTRHKKYQFCIVVFFEHIGAVEVSLIGWNMMTNMAILSTSKQKPQSSDFSQPLARLITYLQCFKAGERYFDYQSDRICTSGELTPIPSLQIQPLQIDRVTRNPSMNPQLSVAPLYLSH